MKPDIYQFSLAVFDYLENHKTEILDVDGNGAVAFVFECAVPDIWQNATLTLGECSSISERGNPSRFFQLHLLYIYGAADFYYDLIGKKKYVEAIISFLRKDPTCGGRFIGIERLNVETNLVDRAELEGRQVGAREEYSVADINVTYSLANT